jgi:hypothetical protein
MISFPRGLEGYTVQVQLLPKDYPIRAERLFLRDIVGFSYFLGDYSGSPPRNERPYRFLEMKHRQQIGFARKSYRTLSQSSFQS